ncbi:Ail/Lom family outer membrane beta-barrel protein [Salmonella enterica subsp. enterica serovar Livingstone]|uniref:Ail/Lom family outer membrane beta-barrel protein n=1 Tax=Salmonella oranienberg TaxID=28147 RepID=A0A5I4QGV0_SALON|nr:outer membrane beta-barrel protein [Salmonella enterica]EBS1756929.1 hypothetical protein [Salmonella enterica subsp. enterica serovar Oranienburg]ECO0593820.1 outer membrane beta-barrel protein [Salmonella enterica subsp. enterica serovar Montevideo]EDA5883650.1 Ail/Lom family outer membrane beta-barrel protein [Salmonella enterica subsp. enterica serovar Infantis]EED7480470.1 Ail/Lom family outer membrane beta-barrel protein [Salmonella enterica subsp. enterica serovar Livingstone]HCZ3100
MKKLVALALGTLLISSVAHAEQGNQTVSIGFIQMKSDGLHNIYKDTKGVASLYGMSSSDGYDDPKGMFMRYHYEFDDVWGIIGSFSYAVNDGKVTANTDSLRATAKITAEYASALVGPSLRVNDYVSLYGLAGMAYKHIKQNIDAYTQYGSGNSSISEDKFNFAYSIGAQINVYEGLVFDAAYEASPGNSDWKTSGFTVGLGYKF